MTTDFAGQVALVIGGASGMGKATARILAGRGARVIIADHDEAATVREAKAMAEEGLAVVGRALDARSSTDRAALFAFIEANHGGLNILFNTIGTRGPRGVEVDETTYDDTFDLNVKAHYYSVVDALPLLRAGAPKASVTLMSSGAGLSYSGRSPLYSITKAAVIMMARTMARDLGPSGIRVNALCPGAVDTPFAGGEPDPEKRAEGLAAFAQTIPLRRVASADDVGQVVAFLASDAGSYLTGLAIPVDGGALA